MAEVAVRCRGVRKSYGEGENRAEVLKGIDLDVESGELTLLVGPSGSGKTTLLSILATILTPDQGELTLLDKSIKGMTEDEKALFRRDHLGIVFQSFFLMPSLTVAENVVLPLVVSGKNQEAAFEKAHGILKRMNLDHKFQSSPLQLSKGQQQRVAIARAIINDAEIIVCDEPTSSLDQASGFEVMTILQELALSFSKTVLVVTHDHRTFSFANRVINMNDGQIVPGEKHE